MVKCVACLTNEANPEHFRRFNHFYCDECVRKATAEAAQEGREEQDAKKLIEYIRDNCGKSGSHDNDRCLYCGRCPITDLLRKKSPLMS